MKWESAFLFESLLMSVLLIANSTVVSNEARAQAKRSSNRNTGQQGKSRDTSGVQLVEATDPESVQQAARELLEELTEQTAPELMAALRQAPEVEHRISNVPGCPVTITSARDRRLRIDYFYDLNLRSVSESGGPTARPAADSYLFSAGSVSFKNNTSREITHFTITLEHDDGSGRQYVDASLKPGEVASAPVRNWLWVSQEVESFVFRVVTVEFKGGKVWGKPYRIPPPPPPPPAPAPAIARIARVEKIMVPPKLRLVRKLEQELRAAVARPLEPSYPRGARGIASVHLIVAPTGKVVCAIYLAGPPLLRSALIEAVKQWTFKPAPGEVAVGVLSFKND